jgi:2,4-dienoyl-CoA reductase-like NADH-dependent reductase (Old Yellow Enzyme family)
MSNRFMLAPLTNQQSSDDGKISEDELRWLTMRAQGGFGLVMTCASHVQRQGRGFPGQLGCWSDDHVEGLSGLASALRGEGSIAVVQLHHAGRRSPEALTGQVPVAPSADGSTGARALSTAEVEEVIEAFVAAAQRCELAGFDGVELHGAHDYLLCEFLNAELNVRSDRFGGSRAGRFQIFAEIIAGIRERCRPDLLLSVRLSPEGFGMSTLDVLDAYERLVATGEVDVIDLSLWDCFKTAIDPALDGRPLLEPFAAVDRGQVRLAVAGHLYSGADVQRALDLGADIVAIGKAAITNHDLPRLLAADPSASMRELPVDRATLVTEGLGPAFLGYLLNWPGFVAD